VIYRYRGPFIGNAGDKHGSSGKQSLVVVFEEKRKMQQRQNRNRDTKPEYQASTVHPLRLLNATDSESSENTTAGRMMTPTYR
jgi:hypothetical protein